MNVTREVFERCSKMIADELNKTQSKIRFNRQVINNTAKEQRVLKSTVSSLFKMKRELEGKSVKVVKKHSKKI